jgi:hypothetical protein
MYGAETTLACTLTPLLAALVLHTQMANVAVLPDLTSLEVVKDSTLTQSCGVFAFGGGDLLGVGVGVGLGDLPEELGDGEGDVGLDALPVGRDELGDFASEPEALGLDEGLALAESLDGDALAAVLGEALGEVALLLDAELAGELLPGSMMAAVSTVSFGSDEHAG